MNTDEKYMQRCIELGQLGAGFTAPNPMVGCIIVNNGKIIGEGYHEKYGEAHAEVNAIKSVKNQGLLKQSKLYVSLEPCSHYGKTPPCSDLIVSKQIPEVLIGTIDPYDEVAGQGVEHLRKAGIKVKVGILEKECREFNRRFFTYHEKKRPYVILKWAQTLDNYIDIEREVQQYGEPTWITGTLARRLVHKIRSEEAAILVGTNTAEKDNPLLTVYNWSGPNAVRAVVDRSLRLSKHLKLFDNSTKTIVFNSLKSETKREVEFVKTDFNENLVAGILDELYKREIQSVIVEGGKQLIESFISQNLWDEAHLFIGNKLFHGGVKAPTLEGTLVSETILDSDLLKIIINQG